MKNEFGEKDFFDTAEILQALQFRIDLFAQTHRQFGTKLRPRQIKTCVLLNKPARRVENVQADYAGFEIPDLFVVGYGLDYAERYRNLPFVGVLKPEMYRA